MEPSTPTKPKNDEVSLKEVILSIRYWLKYLRSKWKVLGLALVVGAIVGAAYSFFSPREYVAKSTFVLDQENQSNPLSALTGVTSILGGGSTDGSLFSGDNLIWLYTSNRMLGETLLTPVKNDSGKQVLLVNWLIQIDGDLQEAVNNIKKKYGTEYQSIPNISINANQLSLSQNTVLTVAIGRIQKDYLEVANESDNTTGIISVTVTSEDELFSLDFTNTIVSHVNKFYITTQTKKAQEQVDVLQKKVDQFNKSMNQSMYEAASAAQAIPFANPNLPTLEVQPQRKVVDVKVNAAIYTSMVQQLEAAKLTLANETPLIQVVDAPTFPLSAVKWGYVKSAVVFGLIIFILALISVVVYRYYKNVLEQE